MSEGSGDPEIVPEKLDSLFAFRYSEFANSGSRLWEGDVPLDLWRSCQRLLEMLWAEDVEIAGLVSLVDQTI